jgi:hypothetical protein
MTQEWANQLLDLGYQSSLPLSYNRVTGAVDYTLGQLADQDPDTNHKTFHFVLNNTVVKDNRIPPFGMSYEEARQRNALPVPADQYGNPAPDGRYDYFDSITLNPPTGAVYAEISLMYQPTSWEYIQFLYLANDGFNPFLAEEGANLLDAWLNTGMAEPYVIASTTWGDTDLDCNPPIPTLDVATAGHSQVTLTWSNESTDANVVGYRIYYDQAGKAQLVAEITDPQVTMYTDTDLTNGIQYCYKVTSYYQGCESSFSNIICAIPSNQGEVTDPDLVTVPAGVNSIETGIYAGKGKNKTLVDTLDTFTVGDSIVIHAYVLNQETGEPVAGATVDLLVTGPESLILVTAPSDADGIAEVIWQTKTAKGKDPGTTLGEYTVQTKNITVNGYHWDMVTTNTAFNIN